MIAIQRVRAREILDSRGNPTIEAELTLENNITCKASVPSGASTGSREAIELRDGDPARYKGKGVLKAIMHINTIIHDALKNQKFSSQALLDEKLLALDGTPNKAKLGANAILAVSLAYAKAIAKFQNQTFYQYLNSCMCTMAKGHPIEMVLPVPLMNLLNGGVHANNGLAFQEFMVVPYGAPTFSEALRYGAEIFHVLKEILQNQGLSTAVGDEGGFAPPLKSARHALDLLTTAIQKAGFNEQQVGLALDVASTELLTKHKYRLAAEQLNFTSSDFVHYLEELVRDYPIVSVEDGMAENDWEGWHELTQHIGDQVQLVGDDLFVTNPEILQRGIDEGIANAILIKLNQIGTLTETLRAIYLAQTHEYGVIISHRSGETEDTTIADLAVASGAGQIKTGSLCRVDRTVKYNQLLRIEEQMGTAAKYLGNTIFSRYLSARI